MRFHSDYGLVSIIMPAHNVEEFIATSINSVLAQTYPNWELIVIDDGSSDNTVQVIQETMRNNLGQLKLLTHPKPQGAALARNYALREATGRWIAFLDSDDLWEPEKLAQQLHFMVENNYSFSATHYAQIDAEGNPADIVISAPKKITRLGFYLYDWVGCLTVIYDQEKIGLVQVPPLKKRNDYAMWLQVSRKAACHVLPEVLAQYRRGRENSLSGAGVRALIPHHYRLFREADQRSAFGAASLTLVNLVFGFLKKALFHRRQIIGNKSAAGQTASTKKAS